MYKRQDLHRHAGVTEARPRQTVERGNVLGHFVEQTFNRHKTVLAGDVVNEVVQKFPFGARVAGCLDRFHEFLDAAFAVRERAAFFNMRAAGQNVMCQLRRRVRQNVADDERVELREQIRANPVLRDVFAENDERPDFAARNSVRDLRNVCADLGETNSGQSRACLLYTSRCV